MRTERVLMAGASGIAYRAQQLADVAKLFASGVSLKAPDAWVMRAVNNALIESALVNARALAWFFTKPSDVHTSWFNESWEDDVRGVAIEVIRPVSRHLGHATAGSPDGETHPGEWPISELAAVLVGAVDRFVRSIREPGVAGWFSPSLTETMKTLERAGVLSRSTDLSANPSVAALTESLQTYLGRHR